MRGAAALKNRFSKKKIKMFLYLVHHGEAVDAASDPRRPLSEMGSIASRRIAVMVAAKGAKPEAIWHSGKYRARQTADILWRECNPLAENLAIHGLRPNDSTRWIIKRLFNLSSDTMLVGHVPHLDDLLRVLVADESTVFPVHGFVALQRFDNSWRECWRLTENRNS